MGCNKSKPKRNNTNFSNQNTNDNYRNRDSIKVNAQKTNKEVWADVKPLDAPYP